MARKWMGMARRGESWAQRVMIRAIISRHPPRCRPITITSISWLTTLRADHDLDPYLFAGTLTLTLYGDGC